MRDTHETSLWLELTGCGHTRNFVQFHAESRKFVQGIGSMLDIGTKDAHSAGPAKGRTNCCEELRRRTRRLRGHDPSRSARTCQGRAVTEGSWWRAAILTGSCRLSCARTDGVLGKGKACPGSSHVDQAGTNRPSSTAARPISSLPAICRTPYRRPSSPIVQASPWNSRIIRPSRWS